MNLIGSIRSAWTDRQIEVVRKSRGRVQKEVAESLNVEPSTVSRTLALAHYRPVLRGEEAARALLRKLGREATQPRESRLHDRHPLAGGEVGGLESPPREDWRLEAEAKPHVLVLLDGGSVAAASGRPLSAEQKRQTAARARTRLTLLAFHPAPVLEADPLRLAQDPTHPGIATEVVLDGIGAETISANWRITEADAA